VELYHPHFEIDYSNKKEKIITPTPFVRGTKTKNGIFQQLPRYDASLDAVAELTKTLSIADCREGPIFVNEQGKFNDELERIVERDLAGTKQERFYFDVINATAIQRLEAYLITKGLWIVKE
jgi:hypothetical protein